MTRRLFLILALAIAGAIVLAAFWQKWAFHTFVVADVERTEMTRSRMGNMLSRVGQAMNQEQTPAAVGATLGVPAREIDAPPGDAPLRLDLDGVRLYAEHLSPKTLRITAVRGDRVVQVGPIPLGGSRSGLWFTLGTAALVMSSLAALLVAVPLARGLHRLTAAARRIAGGELSARAEVRGPMRELANDFNLMAAHNQRLVENQEHLLEAVSHELRTPCPRIRFAVELIETDAPERLIQRVEGIDRDLDELESLVDELLTFTRARASGVTAERAAISVTQELTRLAADLTDRQAGIEVVSTCVDDLTIFAEPRTLRRALRNVALNAIHYAESQVELSASAVGDFVEIAVGDDGPGIPVEARLRVFDPFTRLDESRDRASGGVGLGLAIVRRIMQLHGGAVRVEDEPTLGGARLVTRWPIPSKPG